MDDAPIPLNWLFLGDAHWLVDSREDAVAAWNAATRARADAETQGTTALLREIARLRVLSAKAELKLEISPED